ncbi:MAG: hypothetical protein ACREDV_12750, partial [Methylocella sp.]
VLILVHPVTGFHVVSVHSIVVLSDMLGKPRNDTVRDIEGARNGADELACIAALDCLVLLVPSKLRLFHAPPSEPLVIYL